MEVVTVDKIIRVNLTDNTITDEAVPDKYKKIGGRALTAQILTDEVDPNCEPLGRHNKLVIAPGLLGGSYLSSSSRLSIGGKSPLTGGIKESNAGGIAAIAMSKMGIKAIILEGESTEGDSKCLYISSDKREISSTDIKGKGVYASAEVLRERYGDKAALILIGPAGEKSFATAGIAINDPQGRPSRYCGRGGLGAVMGVKGLKAIVLDSAGAAGINYRDKKAFQALTKEIVKILLDNPATGDTYPKYGTAAMAARTNALNGLPTYNFSQGTFEHANRIDGEYLYSVLKERGGDGNPTHACMPGCVIKCSNIYADQSGEEIVAPIEYETIGLLGSNCGIGNLDEIAKLNYICNDLGVDTIDIGAAIGIAMEQGLASFGDYSAAAKLFDEIANDTILGKVLAQGAQITGRVLSSKRIPVVKGQAMAAYDPRAIKGLGVTYATSPMGADHTAGNTVRAEIDHKDPKIQTELSRKIQLIAMIADSLGLCMMLMAALGSHLDKLSTLVEHYLGDSYSEKELLDMAAHSINVELEFNRAAGLSAAHDRLPEFMREESLPGIDSVFDVGESELDQIHR